MPCLRSRPDEMPSALQPCSLRSQRLWCAGGVGVAWSRGNEKSCRHLEHRTHFEHISSLKSRAQTVERFWSWKFGTSCQQPGRWLSLLTLWIIMRYSSFNRLPAMTRLNEVTRNYVGGIIPIKMRIIPKLTTTSSLYRYFFLESPLKC